MGPMTDISHLLIRLFFNLFILAVLLRLLLQLSRADFYNPISQLLVKVTDPILLPLQRFIGSIAATLLLILLLQIAATSLLLLVAGFMLPNIMLLLTWALIGCAGLILNTYLIAIILIIVVSWIAPASGHPAIVLLRQLTEPVMAPFRSMIPPLGGLDLSPLLIFLLINVVQIVLNHIALSVGLPPAFVIGV
jgi:YggT family protein